MLAFDAGCAPALLRLLYGYVLDYPDTPTQTKASQARGNSRGPMSVISRISQKVAHNISDATLSTVALWRLLVCAGVHLCVDAASQRGGVA